MKNRLTEFNRDLTSGWTVNDRSGWRTDRMVKGARSKQQENVLVEEVRREVRKIAEGHKTLNQKIDRVEAELKGEIHRLEEKLDLFTHEIIGRTDSLECRLDTLTKKMDGLSKQMNEGFAQITKLLTEFEKQLQHHVHVS